MSAQAGVSANSSSSSKSKKKNHKKKKSGANKAGDDSPVTNGTAETGDAAAAEDGDDVEDSAAASAVSPTENEPQETDSEPQEPEQQLNTAPEDPPRPVSNGTNHTPTQPEQANGLASNDASVPSDQQSDASTQRLDALAKERADLRAEVTALRESLESIAAKHEEEVENLKQELEETGHAKDHAETQYRTLLGRLKDLKAQLGDRLKADKEDLAQAASQIEDLENQNKQLQEAQDERETVISTLRLENDQAQSEIAELRSRTNLSQQNWVKERDDLIAKEAQTREEFENAKQAMQDWEFVAMDERSQREHLSDKMAEVEEQLVNQREAFERAASERDSQSQTVDGLQRALRDIQDARKKELRELVEGYQTQLEDLRKQFTSAEERATTAQTELDKTSTELKRALPFEDQVREKNLLIGKLRHEAVILNDHLTKALRFLKQRKPEDSVDRQIVTNHLLHFIALDRADPKKFQVLQLIAALLSWTEEQKEQAGLTRPGGAVANATGSLRLPQSPFVRSPSTPSLSSDAMMLPQNASSKESLAELWSEFLEREAQEGRSPGSRRTSVTSPAPIERTMSGSGLGLIQEKE